MNTTTTIPTVRIGTAEDGNAVIVPVDRGVVVVGRPGSGKSHLATVVGAALREWHLNAVHVNGRSGSAVDILKGIVVADHDGSTALIIEEADLLLDDAEAERLVRELIIARFPVIIIANRVDAVPHGVLDRAHTKIALSALTPEDTLRLFGDTDVPAKPLDRSLAVVKTNETITAVTIG